MRKFKPADFANAFASIRDAFRCFGFAKTICNCESNGPCETL